MKKIITGKDDLPREICEALGLKHVKSFDLHMGTNDIVTLTVQLYPEVNGLKQLPAILKKYGLVEIE